MEQREALLEFIREHTGCSLREACDRVGVKRKDVRELRRTDHEFEEDYAEARGRDPERIRHEIFRRAIDGDEEMVVDAQGNEHFRTVKSDRLLEFAARTNLPEARELVRGRLEVTGAGGGPIDVQHGVDIAAVAKELLAAGVDLRAIACELEAAEVVAVEDEPVDG